MRKLFVCFLSCLPLLANAQFTPGQVLTAAELNSQFALYAPLAGATFSGPLITGSLTVTGTASLPPISLTGLAAQSANTVVANPTGASAGPIAFSMPSCSTSSSALNWVTSAGFTCNTTINAATLGGATFAAPGPIGLTTPSTGTFTTLTSSTPIAVTSGGTGVGTLTAHNVLLGEGTSTVGFATPGATSGVALVSTGTTTDPSFGTVVASGGGTGQTSLLQHGVMIGEGTAAIHTTAGTTGQMLVGVTSGDPAFGNTISTLTATGTITPSSTNGIVGTATNDNANAGSVGEYVSSSSSAVATSSGTPVNGASISLTAGDWDVTGFCQTNPAATTVINSVVAGISTTSATFGTVAAGINNYSLVNGLTQPAGNLPLNITAPVTRLSLASTTTAFLVCQTGFSTSTLTTSGFIRARRIR